MFYDSKHTHLSVILHELISSCNTYIADDNIYYVCNYFTITIDPPSTLWILVHRTYFEFSFLLNRI